MQLEFVSNDYPCLYRECKELQMQEQTEEIRIPEGMPDIGKILGAWGQCILRGKQWNGEEITVSGGVMVWVLYLPTDGDEPRSIEGWIPVQQKWNVSDSQREGVIRTLWNLKSTDARMLTARKVLIRATVGITAEVLEPRELKLFKPEQVPTDVQLLRREYPTMLPKEAGEVTFRLEESFPLTQGNAPRELIYCNIHPVISEQKVVGNQGAFRGNILCHVLYRTEDGQLYAQDQELSYSQLEELQKEYESEAQLSVLMALTGLETELMDGQLQLRIGLAAQYLVYDRCMLSVVEDAYSPVREVTVQKQPVDIPLILDNSRKTCRPQADVDVDRIADISVMLETPTQRRAENHAELEFSGSWQLLAYDREGKLFTDTRKWSEMWELPMDQNVKVECMASMSGTPVFSRSGEYHQITMDMELLAQTYCAQGLSMMTGFEATDARALDPNRPSIVLRRTRGEGLWDIAKENGSTVQAIYEANHLNQDPLEDRVLLIPIM